MLISIQWDKIGKFIEAFSHSLKKKTRVDINLINPICYEIANNMHCTYCLLAGGRTQYLSHLLQLLIVLILLIDITSFVNYIRTHIWVNDDINSHLEQSGIRQKCIDVIFFFLNMFGLFWMPLVRSSTSYKLNCNVQMENCYFCIRNIKLSSFGLMFFNFYK